MRSIIEGYGLRRFTKPYHGITEISFHLLLDEIESHQSVPHFMGNPGAQDRVGQRRPHKVAIYMNRISTNFKRKRLRKRPEDEDKAENRGNRPKQPAHEGKGPGRKKIDILGNSLVRVIRKSAGKHFHAVKHLMRRPAGKILLRHPPPPAERELLLEVVRIHRKSDVGESKPRKFDQSVVYRISIIILES